MFSALKILSARAFKRELQLSKFAFLSASLSSGMTNRCTYTVQTPV
jgi:hypothetical protein